MADTHRTQVTYRYELLRAGTAGILETAGSTFLLVIAVKWFSAGATAKALVAGGGSLGLLLSPAVGSTVTAAGWPTSRAAARVLAVGAVSFLLAAACLGLAMVLGSDPTYGKSIAGLATAWPQLPIFI